MHVKTDKTTCSLTAWERRHWGQPWETPAGTTLLPETTEVPCLPSLQRFNNTYGRWGWTPSDMCKITVHQPGAVTIIQSSDSRLCRAVKAPHPKTLPDLTTQCPGWRRQWPKGEDETRDLSMEPFSYGDHGLCCLSTGGSPSEIKSWLTCRSKGAPQSPCQVMKPGGLWEEAGVCHCMLLPFTVVACMCVLMWWSADKPKTKRSTKPNSV